MKRQRSSLDGGAGCSAAAPSPDMRPENSEFAYLSSGDVDALDCGVCCFPLNPPIFQCEVGHVVCSPCSDKLKGTGKCHVCGADTSSGGYRRCHAMERVVESVHVPCPNAAYGCAARPAYCDQQAHLQLCLHAPCHCPGEACGFVGTMDALLGHLADVHCWPCSAKVKKDEMNYVLLNDGFNFFVLEDEQGATTAATASTCFCWTWCASR